MFCDKCGTKNRDDSKFCNRCGKPLSQQSATQPSGIIMRFEGENGQIELFKDKLIIKREGFFAVLTQGFTKGEKTIYISQISGIQLKLGGQLLMGYIQFTLPGGNENLGGLRAASTDENSVRFNIQSNDSATKLKEKIEELVQKSRHSTNQTLHVSSADEIRKFKQLLDEGIITKEEFDKKKKELLGL